MTEPGAIDRMFIDLDTNLTRYVREFGVEFMSRVEDRTPVLTGQLKASWHFDTKRGGFVITNLAVNKEDQPYAAYVEFGTDKMPPVAMIRTTLAEVGQISEIAAKRAGLKK